MAKKKVVSKKADKTEKADKPAKKKKAKASGEDGAPKKKKAATKKKAKTKKAVAETRLKLYWGVFNHALKRVALYEFNQRKAADKRAKELSEGGKPPHFVQKIKEVITEPLPEPE